MLRESLTHSFLVEGELIPSGVFRAGDANPWAEMEAQRKSEPTTPNISE